MLKSKLLRAIRQEIHRHDFSHFVDEPPSIAQTLVGIESLLAIQSFHKLPRSLANGSSDAAGIDFYRPALGTNIPVFVFQCDAVRVQSDLP